MAKVKISPIGYGEMVSFRRFLLLYFDPGRPISVVSKSFTGKCFQMLLLCLQLPDLPESPAAKKFFHLKIYMACIQSKIA